MALNSQKIKVGIFRTLLGLTPLLLMGLLTLLTFYLVEKNDRISLYYSIAETLTESRKNDDKIDFEKKETDKVKKGVSQILRQKKLKTKEKGEK